MKVIVRKFSEDHKYLFTKWDDGSISGEPITEDEYLALLPEIYE